MRDGTCLRVICTCLSEGAGAVGAGGGGRESLKLLVIVVDGGAPVGFCETSIGCGLDRGFGDWILVIAWACTGGAGSSSSEDSDSDDDEDDVAESPSSKNSNTLGTFLADSTGLSGGASGAGAGFAACFDALTCSVGDDGLLGNLGLCPGPAWVTVVTLETVDEVLFLPCFWGFLERRLCMMIGKGRK